MEAFSSSQEIRKMAGRGGSCFINFLACVTCGLCCVRKSISDGIRLRNKLPEDHSIDTYIKIIEDRLAATGGKWLHGKNIGVLDVSLYGLFYFFSREPKLAAMDYLFKRSPKITSWYTTMFKLVGRVY